MLKRRMGKVGISKLAASDSSHRHLQLALQLRLRRSITNTNTAKAGMRKDVMNGTSHERHTFSPFTVPEHHPPKMKTRA